MIEVKPLLNEDNSSTTEEVLVDHYNFVYVTFFLLGVGSLFPWYSVDRRSNRLGML